MKKAQQRAENLVHMRHHYGVFFSKKFFSYFDLYSWFEFLILTILTCSERVLCNFYGKNISILDNLGNVETPNEQLYT